MAPSSLLLKAAALAVVGLSSRASAVLGPYQLVDNYQGNPDGTGFFDKWGFNSDNDPTHGYVDYQTAQGARDSQLAYVNGAGQAYLGVDFTTDLSNDNGARGRKSVRIQSNNKYNGGLFIGDIAHMPGSICGVWPAFWTVNTVNYPAGGEIDIIEGISEYTTNLETLHTTSGCTLVRGDQRGTPQGDGNCDNNYSNPPSQYANQGCSVSDTSSTNSYGTPFNNAGGGVYAMEWTDATIKIWNFARDGGIPADITSGNPNPSGWGPPTLTAGGPSCSVSSHFYQHQIIFDNTFCGDFAGQDALWRQTSCYSPDTFPTCKSYVKSQYRSFKDAFWLVNSVKVYQRNNNPTTTSSSATSSAMSSTSSTTSSTMSSASPTTSSSTTSSSMTSSSTTSSSMTSSSMTSSSMTSTTSSTTSSISASVTSSTTASIASSSSSSSSSSTTSSTSMSTTSATGSSSTTSSTSMSTISATGSSSTTSSTSMSTTSGATSSTTSSTGSSSTTSSTSMSTTSSTTSGAASTMSGTGSGTTPSTTRSSTSGDPAGSPRSSSSTTGSTGTSSTTSGPSPSSPSSVSSSQTGSASVPIIPNSGRPASLSTTSTAVAGAGATSNAPGAIFVQQTGTVSITPTGTVQMTTSTAFTTVTSTITQCPPTVTNCPIGYSTVVTSTIALYTTVCPVTPVPTTPAPVTPMTTSTVYTTAVLTITQCPPSVTSCPASLIRTVTSTYALYTTVCPASGAPAATNVQAVSSPAPVVVVPITVVPVASASVASAPVASARVSSAPAVGVPAASVPFPQGNSTRPASSSGTGAIRPTATVPKSMAGKSVNGGSAVALIMVVVAGLLML